ncbi:hypothetical protein B566_EDAN008780 [Ephemera danica]|nr:hypothetical protein B566_EDAN008780 [Ephemera danica]
MLSSRCMSWLFVLTYVLLKIVVSGYSFDPEGSTDVFRLLQRLRSPPQATRRSHSVPRVVQESYFTQRLDHYNVLDDRTWQQRFFISNASYVPGGPVFLFIAGEWVADPSEITDTFVEELAAQHGALLIDLEHRYYGESRPLPDTSTENLKYLNVDQALEDAAVFTVAMMNDPVLNLTGPWITFGRSYAGQLSAWARARYPHLYHAAIASSATVLAKLDVPEYYEVVNVALETSSPECPLVISEAMAELQLLVDQGDSANITELFNLCGEIDLSIPEDVMTLYMYIAGYYGNAVQYARNGSTDEICRKLIEGRDAPLDTMAQMIRRAYFPICLVTSTDKILNYFHNYTNWNFELLRQYYYQLCVEFGQYMSLSSPNQPFGQVVPVELYLLWCPNVYGPEFTRELNEEGIARTNLVYGGINPDVTHVLYTHGSLDPWYPIGVLQDLGPDTPMIMIEATTSTEVDPELSTDVFQLMQSLHRPPPPLEPSSKAVLEGYFTQKLDHFNILDDRTWQQRYFIANDTYVAGSPIFLYLAGEWTADPAEVTDSFVAVLAAQHNALMVDLEHRYYGLSYPTNDTSTENLKYLSIEQALEDAATFTVAMMQDTEMNLTGPWVVIGASYSAQLSAWARAKYPHLFYAAYASSAPVYMQLDIPEYFEVVDDALEATSPECPGVITAAMDELQVLIDQGDSANITDLFNLCKEIDLSDPDDIMTIYLYTSLYYASQVQYARNGSLDEVCDTLIAGKDEPLDTLARMVRRAYFPLCLVSSTDAILSFFHNVTSFRFQLLRQFMYQACTEFGHYPSLTSPNQPFGQVLPVEFYLLWCPNVYAPEFTREVNEAGLERTNLLYGGRTPDVTRVIYTHGSLDPWHPFGILQDLGPDTPVIMMNGESHCRDLNKAYSFDSQELIDARIQIAQILDSWLQEVTPMAPRVSIFVVLALVVAAVAASSVNRMQLMKRGPPPVEEKYKNRALEEEWITQKLNHFDVLDTSTWQQRYFYSMDDYVPGGPVFLYLAGEWTADGYEIVSTFVGDIARKHGGFMIDLEHRYYGASHPTSNLTTDNLQWLNDDQALEDAAYFTQTMMADPRFNLTGPWIVVGGSYSANLAAWARARYPHLYYAAWASSGPVLAKLDFFEYYEVVDDALESTSSPDCTTVIQAATDELDALVAAGDAATITTLFNFCNTVDLSNPDDVMNVYSYYSGFFAGEVQYARYGNLDTICADISAGQATPLETVTQIIRDAYAPSCLWASNQNILDFYKFEVLYTGDATRQWFYQACTEYGYWQSLASPNQPFGQSNPVEFSLLWCSNVYGPEFTKEVNQAGIDRTNLQNGGLNPDVSRVLYVHGSLDPWHALGIQSDLNADSPVVMIAGESHCRDIGTPNPMDSQALKDARIQIDNIIAAWLAQATSMRK